MSGNGQAGLLWGAAEAHGEGLVEGRETVIDAGKRTQRTQVL